MTTPKLEKEEYIIASDKVSCGGGLFKRNGTLYLTNERLLFFDASSFRKPQNHSIDHDEIDLLEAVSSGFHIQTSGQNIYFYGSGAVRIFDRLSARRNILSLGSTSQVEDINDVKEIILLQGDISLKTPSGTHSAQLFLTSKELHINPKASFFKRQEAICFPIESIAEFEYTLSTKSISITRVDNADTIVLSGAIAPQCYLQLISYVDGGSKEGWNGTEVGYSRGILKIKGLLNVTKKRVVFCPTEILDTVAQAKNILLDIAELTKLEIRGWPEKSINLYTNDPHLQLSLTTKSTLQDFPLFRKALVTTPPTNPWKVHSKAELMRVNTKWGLSLKANAEKILLISWSTLKLDKETYVFGWLLLSNLQFYFFSIDPQYKFQAPIVQLQKLFEQFGGIRFSYKNNDYEFLCAGGGHFSSAFWQKITSILPPKDIVGARSGQPLAKILGPSHLALIFKEGLLVHQIVGILVRKQKNRIVIQCDPIAYSELKKNDLIEIEIPKMIGRFRFHVKVLENYLVKGTPIGAYEIIVALPDNIYVYNQRKSFRIDFVQSITCSIHTLAENQSVLLYEELPVEKDITGLTCDISFGGLRILFEESFQETKENLLVRFSCVFEGETLLLQGMFKHIFYVPEKKLWSHGIQFVNIPDSVEQKIFKHVLEIERDILQKDMDEEEEE